MKKVTLSLFLLLTAAMLSAQAVEAVAVVQEPNFFIALIGGIIIALGFQLLLTNLTAASGLSILHAPLEKLEEGPSDRERTGHEQGEEKGAGVHKAARNVSRAFGFWAVITTTIALFFASWLAVELSGTARIISGVTIGLAIWGLLYIVNLALEMKAVGSMTGSLMHLAGSGLKSAGEAAGGLFGKSDEKKMADTAAEVAASVRDEIFHDVNLKKEISRFVDQVKPNYAEMRKQFESILKETNVDVTTRHEAPLEERTTAEVHVGAGGPSMKDAGDKATAAASKVQEVRGKVQEEMKSDKDTPSKVADAAMETAGLSREQAEEYRHRIEDYLRNTGKPELNPEGIKRDLEKLFSDPKGGFQALKEHLGQFDKSTITSLLSQRKDMDENEANRVVDWVSNTLDTIRGTYQGAKEDVKAGAGERAAGMQERASGLEGKVKEYFDSLDRPELQYEDIKGDFELLLHDPKAGADALLTRLKSMDRDSLKAIISSRKDISEEDADRMIDKMEEARDSMIQRVERMKEETARRLEQLKEEAAHQADEVRKTAASATWWVFAAALVSGIAAAAGGWVATIV